MTFNIEQHRRVATDLADAQCNSLLLYIRMSTRLKQTSKLCTNLRGVRGCLSKARADLGDRAEDEGLAPRHHGAYTPSSFSWNTLRDPRLLEWPAHSTMTGLTEAEQQLAYDIALMSVIKLDAALTLIEVHYRGSEAASKVSKAICKLNTVLRILTPLKEAA